MKKRIILLSICGLFVFAVLWGSHKIFIKPKRVIFIILDAARADHLSCYGYPKVTTPNIDAIACRGVIFKHNFTQATFTLLSIPSILFSRYRTLSIFQPDAWMWGVKKEGPNTIGLSFDAEQILLPDMLSQRGYRTGVFSRHSYFIKETYLAKHFGSLVNTLSNTQGEAMEENNAFSELISWIKKNKKDRLFAYWHIVFPHAGYPPGIERKEFFDVSDAERIRKWQENYSPYTLDDIECRKGLYDSSLWYVDTLIGAFFAELKQLHLLGHTLIIITSDHGEHLGEHGIAEHGDPAWDSVIHVPLIMYCPEAIPKGVAVNGLTESVDIAPTILDICGINLPKGKSFDGRSLLYAMRHPDKGKEYVITANAIRTPKYKYFVATNLLFDLTIDPKEKHNIASNDSVLANKMRALYEKVIKPYKERFEKSVRNTPIDYPFYFAASVFTISPADAFKREDISVDKLESSLRNADSRFKTESWVLNSLNKEEKLMRIPLLTTSVPLTLSSSLPSGKYSVLLLLQSPVKIDVPQEHFSLRYRFGKKAPFRDYARKAVLFRKEENKTFFYYLNMGQAVVRNNKFSLEIDFSPKDGQIYAFCHVKFTPKAAENGKGSADALSQNEEFHKRREGLRSLGYLQ